MVGGGRGHHRARTPYGLCGTLYGSEKGCSMQDGEGRAELSIVARSLADSENSRTFFDGSARSMVRLRSAVIGLGTYKPGWKWSLHAGAQTGKPSENHVGYIISGKMVVQDASGFEQEIGPGEAFEVAPGHDAWVVGGVPCIALDFAHPDA